jgi:hypothetical protein
MSENTRASRRFHAIDSGVARRRQDVAKRFAGPRHHHAFDLRGCTQCARPTYRRLRIVVDSGSLELSAHGDELEGAERSLHTIGEHDHALSHPSSSHKERARRGRGARRLPSDLAVYQ